MARHRIRSVVLVAAVTAAVWFLPRPQAVSADTIELKDGTVLTGKVVSEVKGRVAFLVGGELKWLDRSAVKKITIGGKAPAAKDFEIRLERPFQAGDRFRFTATASRSESQRVSAGGKVVEDKTSRSTVRLEAHSRASAVITLALRPLISAAQAGVLGTPSSSPSTYFRKSSKPSVRPAIYSLS